jgi:hypothetical protein
MPPIRIRRRDLAGVSVLQNADQIRTCIHLRGRVSQVFRRRKLNYFLSMYGRDWTM